MHGKLTLIAICGLCLLGASCTERRRASQPVADGDTIEVVIPEPQRETGRPVRIIEVNDGATQELLIPSADMDPNSIMIDPSAIGDTN